MSGEPGYSATAHTFPHRIVQVTTPVPEPTWAEVLASDPGATALQTPEYLAAVLRGRGGHDASRLYTLSDGRKLVLPLVRTLSLPGLRMAAGYPAGYGHGSLLATGGLRADDVREVVRDLRCPGQNIRIGGGHHTAEQWAAGVMRGVAKIHRQVEVLDLSPGWDAVLAGFSRAARQNVRKAARRGVEIERDTSGRLAPVFHELYRSWVERWIPRSGLPAPVARWSALKQEPYEKFEAVASLLGEHCRVFIAWHQGRAVAGCINFVYGEHAIGWRSYSLRDLVGPLGANTAVQAAGLQDAAGSGCRVFDLGQSGGVSSLHNYKHSLGAHPRGVVDLRIEPLVVSRVRSFQEQAKQRAIALISRRSD